MMRTIKNPHWINNARTMLSAEFHYEDGRVLSAVINKSDANNPDWIEVMEKFSSDDIEKNTREAIRRQASQRDAQERAEKAAKDRKQQEDLFAIKLQAFELPVVKNATNRSLKSQIRRAKSDFEVYAYTAALILSEQQKPVETTE